MIVPGGFSNKPYAQVTANTANFPGLRAFFKCNETSGTTLTSTQGTVITPFASPTYSERFAVTIPVSALPGATSGTAMTSITSGNWLMVAVFPFQGTGVGGNKTDVAFGDWINGTNGYVGWVNSNSNKEFWCGTINNYTGWGAAPDTSIDVCYAYGSVGSGVTIKAGINGDLQTAGTADVASFTFAANEMLHTEATDLYGAFMYALGANTLTDAQIIEIATWCRTNWQAGYKEMPPLLAGV